MLEISSQYYGDAFGLAPIVLAQKQIQKNNYWSKECKKNPTQLSCLLYDTQYINYTNVYTEEKSINMKSTESLRIKYRNFQTIFSLKYLK